MAYSTEEKAKALMALVSNQLDFYQTADETGISHMTLRRWWREEGQSNFELVELLQNAATSMLLVMPQFTSGKDWAIALGIVIDKLAMLTGIDSGKGEGVTVNVSNTNNNAVLVEAADLGAMLQEAEGALRELERLDVGRETIEGEVVQGEAEKENEGA